MPPVLVTPNAAGPRSPSMPLVPGHPQCCWSLVTPSAAGLCTSTCHPRPFPVPTILTAAASTWPASEPCAATPRAHVPVTDVTHVYTAWPLARPASSKLHEARPIVHSRAPAVRRPGSGSPEAAVHVDGGSQGVRLGLSCLRELRPGGRKCGGEEGAGRGCWLLPQDPDLTAERSFPLPASRHLREKQRGGTEEREGKGRAEEERCHGRRGREGQSHDEAAPGQPPARGSRQGCRQPPRALSKGTGLADRDGLGLSRLSLNPWRGGRRPGATYI